MFTKKWQRLIKESLIAIYHNDRTKFAKNFPIYYFAYNNDLEATGLAVHALQTLPMLPWPDEECIILAEDVCLSAMSEDYHGLCWIIHTNNFKAMVNSPEKSELMMAGHVTLTGDGRLIHQPYDYYFMQHNEKWNVDESRTEESLQNRADTVSASCAALGLRTRRDNFLTYMRKVCMLKNQSTGWVCNKVSDPTKKLQPGLAADFLAYLSNLAVPCHYMVRSRFSTGFGPTSEIRRLAIDKPIFSVIPFDRLYTQFTSDGKCHFEISPHFRHGHVRHLWKDAGVDRLALPPIPIERLRIAQEKRVRRIYIPPTWIGEKEFNAGEMRYEAITDELPLRLL